MSRQHPAAEDLQHRVTELLELNAGLEERVRARTAELSSTLSEREALRHEVHHRVKNNLQVISSLIHLQAGRLPDGAGRSALDACQNRLQALALVHDRIYQAQDYAHVRFSEYAGHLIAGVFHAVAAPGSGIALSTEIDEVSLPVDRAIPCGLILNELVTNAIEHAFPGGKGGTIRVALHALRDGRLVLSVSDDGVGMTARFDEVMSRSVGVTLVSALVEQLDGELELIRDVGTTVRITFAPESRD